MDLWRRSALLGCLVLLAALLVGCVGPADEVSGGSEPDPTSSDLPEFELVGKDCIEGGGQSVHPRSIAGQVPFHIPPAPWQRADVLEDTGPQVVYSEVTDPLNPVPTEGETWGNIHVTLWCEHWTFNGQHKPDFVFGYVGAKVEDPPFSDGAPSRSWLVTVVAANDAEVLDALHAAGIHAMHTSATMELDDVKMHTVLDTEHHGTYESMFLLKELGEMPEEPYRLWWQSENGNDTYTPVSLDLNHSAGARHYGAEAQGYFSHTGTDMHGPQGGGWSNSAAVAWIGHDRVITLGPRPGVEIDEAYHH